jgi:hypothetical protein
LADADPSPALGEGDHKRAAKRVTARDRARLMEGMGDAPGKKRVSRRGLSSLLCTLAFGSLACASAPRVSVQSAVSSLADPPMHLREGGAKVARAAARTSGSNTRRRDS